MHSAVLVVDQTNAGMTSEMSSSTLSSLINILNYCATSTDHEIIEIPVEWYISVHSGQYLQAYK